MIPRGAALYYAENTTNSSSSFSNLRIWEMNPISGTLLVMTKRCLDYPTWNTAVPKRNYSLFHPCDLVPNRIATPSSARCCYGEGRM